MKFQAKYCLVDIDGTLTDYRAGALAPEKMLHGNFLFPIIRDGMLEQGWENDAAETAIRDLAEKIVFWDYTDFIAEFRLPVKETFRRIREWHRENILACPDAVQTVKTFAAEGRQLFIMSNNPYTGCLFKLQAAGLAEDDFSSPYFRRIFGTNLLRGCKNSPDTWKRALAQIPAELPEIGVIGDNPVEDEEIPRSCGIMDFMIFQRKKIARGIDGDASADAAAWMNNIKRK